MMTMEEMAAKIEALETRLGWLERAAVAKAEMEREQLRGSLGGVVAVADCVSGSDLMPTYDPRSITLTIGGVPFRGATRVDYDAPPTPSVGEHHAVGTIVAPPGLYYAALRLITGGGITAEELRYRLARLRATDPLPLP